MTLLLTLLPVYLMGNLHCLGMCGPIAMWVGASHFRYFYLAGRVFSFTLAGMLAGGFGEVLNVYLSQWHLSAVFSILLGSAMIMGGLSTGLGYRLAIVNRLSKTVARWQFLWHGWFMNNEPWPLFMLGLLTIALPCGQTLLVYSACALSGSAMVGMINGFAFSILTTPSLFTAMRFKSVILRVQAWYMPIITITACLVGIIACLRGLAELGIIRHMGMHPLILY